MKQQGKSYYDKKTNIIVKDVQHAEVLRKLEFERTPQVIAAREASKALVDKMNAKFYKEFPMETKRDRRRAKKRKKSLRYLEVGQISYKRLFKFLAGFFCVLFVGAVISWIVLAGKKIDVDKYFTAQSFVTTYENNNATSTSNFEQMDINKLTSKKFKENSYPLENECKLVFKENDGALSLATISFNVKTNGYGALTLLCEYYDSTLEDGEKLVKVATSGTSIIEKEKTIKFSFRIVHKFTQLDNLSYIKISLVQENTEGITALKFYNLKIEKI